MKERDHIQFCIDELDQIEYDAFVESLQVRNINFIGFDERQPAHFVLTLSFKQFRQLRGLLNEPLTSAKGGFKTYFVTVINLFPIGAVSQITPQNLESSVEQIEPVIRQIMAQRDFDATAICLDRQLVLEQFIYRVYEGDAGAAF